MYIYIDGLRWSWGPREGQKGNIGYIREVKDVQEASNTRSVLAVEYRRTFGRPFPGRIPYTTDAIVATSEVQRFECLSWDYSSAYSRNVGGSTLRVPVEGLFQCLQSQRRRFNAPSLKCHIRRDFKDTGHVAQHSPIPSSEPERRPTISTTPRKDCELIPSCWEGLGGFKRPSMMPGNFL